MNRFFVIFLLIFLGFANYSHAACVLEKSTDVTPSNEDLYPQNPNDSRMALICQSGKCENGSIAFALSGHYLESTLVEKAAFYKCNHGWDDRWEHIESNSIHSSCSYLDIRDKTLVFKGASGGVYGTQVADGLWANVCFKPYPQIDGFVCNYDNIGEWHEYDSDTLYVCEEDANFVKLVEYKYETKSGVKCNPDTAAEPEFRWFTDPDVPDLYVCFLDSDRYRWAGSDFVSNNWACSYSDPTTRVVGKYTTNIGGFQWSVGGQIEKYNWFATRNIVNGDKIAADDKSDVLCYACDDGYYANASGGSSISCYDSLDRAWCEWRSNVDNKDTSWDGEKCTCNADGMTWDVNQHDCVGDGAGGAAPAKKTCEQLHPNGSPLRLACCRAGNKTTWNGDETKGTCTCKTGTWKYTDGDTYGKCEDVKAGGTGGTTPGVTVAPNTQELNDAIERIKSLMDAKTTVWRTAEGKFNSARLASDATAGVVLGTVGGIVSAKVIKKKQVQKGFDALKCVVGGQGVADFGDEFIVGFGRH